MLEDVPPSRLIKNDYLTLILLVGGPALLAGVLFESWGDPPEDRHGPLAIAGTVTVALFALGARRIADLRRRLRVGQRVPGTITAVWFYKDRGRIEFDYKYGVPRHGGAAVHKTSDTEGLQVGQTIDLILDPDRPDRPLVLGLYAPGGFRRA
jgi:hypothetical protein